MILEASKKRMNDLKTTLNTKDLYFVSVCVFEKKLGLEIGRIATEYSYVISHQGSHYQHKKYL